MASSYLMIFQNHTISDSHHFQHSTPLKKSSNMPKIWQKREEKSCLTWHIYIPSTPKPRILVLPDRTFFSNRLLYIHGGESASPKTVLALRVVLIYKTLLCRTPRLSRSCTCLEMKALNNNQLIGVIWRTSRATQSCQLVHHCEKS